MYKSIIKPILFNFQPEQSHHFALKSFRTLLSIPIVSSITRSMFKFDASGQSVNLHGIDFPNRVGLAAGFDKDGQYIKELDALGFGFIEVGTVTPLPQVGNPQPRLFRLPKDNALINRMGFNNDGVEGLVSRLKALDRSKIKAVIGGNIGKNKVTPNEEAHEDYRKCFVALHPYVDYFVVNVSSPNTPGLRKLQDKDSLALILNTILNTDEHKANPKPIFLKISPDLTDEAVAEITDLVNEVDIQGLIVSNTTISRTNLKTADSQIESIGNGGLSGMPVRNQSNHVLKLVKSKLNANKSIIGVGGIFTAVDAKAKLDAGADLVQVYTGFIYEGPTMIKRINQGLAKV